MKVSEKLLLAPTQVRSARFQIVAAKLYCSSMPLFEKRDCFGREPNFAQHPTFDRSSRNFAFDRSCEYNLQRYQPRETFGWDASVANAEFASLLSVDMY